MTSIKDTMNNIIELLELIVDSHCEDKDYCEWCIEARKVLNRIKN